MQRYVSGQAPLTLGLGTSLLRRDLTAGLIAAVLALPLAAIAGLLYLARDHHETEGPVAAAAQALRSALDREPDLGALLWLAAALLPLAIVFLLAQRAATLRVDTEGLAARIPRWLGIGLFRQTAGEWRIAWHTIRRVRLVQPRSTAKPVQQLGGFRLVIETDHGETWLSPFLWFDRSGDDHRLRLAEVIRSRRLDAARLLERAPLLRALQARGFELETSAANVPRRAPGFDLARHRGMAAQLVALFATGLYALLDTFFFGHYLPLEPLPTLPFALVAAAATVGVGILGRGAPAVERLAVGALTVAAVTWAVYPATLRLNALSATPVSVIYVATAPGRFHLPGAGVPAIDLTGHDVDAYWAQYPQGTLHEFTLLRGDGGFYQLDLSPLHARTRRFYQEREQRRTDGER